MKPPYGFPLVESCMECKLRSSNWFCDLPVAELAEFEKIQNPMTYPEGAVLFVEGQEPRGAFMLCSGMVKLTMTSYGGKSIIVKVVKPGEMVGLDAVLHSRACEVTAETLQSSQLNFIRRDDLLGFLQRHGDATLRAAQHMSSNCHIAYQQIRSIGLAASAREKVAHVLLDWAANGEKTPKGLRVKVALSHEEIAQLVGCTRETVTRTLSDFKRRKIAELRGSSLFVYDREALSTIAAA
jgi:CRP/FNR family transcriptional regulator, cyclic AMP receptor protein